MNEYEITIRVHLPTDEDAERLARIVNANLFGFKRDANPPKLKKLVFTVTEEEMRY